MLRNYRDLIAWQKAMDLVEFANVLTKTFPKEEIYGLAAQLRRAAVPVPSNIAEGLGPRLGKRIRLLSHCSPRIAAGA